jgi:hypothetical protein
MARPPSGSGTRAKQVLVSFGVRHPAFAAAASRPHDKAHPYPIRDEPAIETLSTGGDFWG